MSNFSFDGQDIGNMADNCKPIKNSYDSEVPRHGFFEHLEESKTGNQNKNHFSNQSSQESSPILRTEDPFSKMPL